MRVNPFLKEQKILRLTTVSPKGVPHTVPVWYLYSAKKFYIGTNTRTIKAKNLQKNSRVAFCIDVGINAPDIYGVTGYGTAHLVRDDEKVKRIATRILSRYFETITCKSAQELLRDTNCIVIVTPDKMSKWHY